MLKKSHHMYMCTVFEITYTFCFPTDSYFDLNSLVCVPPSGVGHSHTKIRGGVETGPSTIQVFYFSMY